MDSPNKNGGVTGIRGASDLALASTRGQNRKCPYSLSFALCAKCGAGSEEICGKTGVRQRQHPICTGWSEFSVSVERRFFAGRSRALAVTLCSFCDNIQARREGQGTTSRNCFRHALKISARSESILFGPFSRRSSGLEKGPKSLPRFSSKGGWMFAAWGPCCRRERTCAGRKGYIPLGIDPTSEVVWSDGDSGGAYRVLRAVCGRDFFTAGLQQACRPQNPPGRGALGPWRG